jgi:hypothetical protein
MPSISKTAAGRQLALRSPPIDLWLRFMIVPLERQRTGGVYSDAAPASQERFAGKKKPGFSNRAILVFRDSEAGLLLNLPALPILIGYLRGRACCSRSHSNSQST